MGSMMAEYSRVITIAVGDLDPPFVGHVFEGKSLKNLTGYTALTFYMRNLDTEINKVDGETSGASITDAANGEVAYQWASGDTDTAGRYATWVTYLNASGSIGTAAGPEVHIVEAWELMR